MIYKQGEILIVPFPFSDLSSIQQRPVLVLSKSNDNEKGEDIVTCGITLNLRDSKYSLVFDNENLESGSIPKKSRIKIDKLFTLSKRMVRKGIGRLNKMTFEMVREEFRKLV